MLARLVEALPVLVVLLGLVLVWIRNPRSIPGVPLDGILLSWCAIALLHRQVLFLLHAQLDWRALPVWGIVLGAALPTTMVLFVPSRRWRAAAAWLVVMIATVLMTVDSLYYAWFGDVFPTVAGLAVRQIGSVTGGAGELLSGRDYWNFVDVALAAPLVAMAWRPADRPARSRAMMLAVCGPALVFTILCGWQTAATIRADRTIVTQRFSNLSLVEQIGPFPFHALDAWLVGRRAVASELVNDEIFEEELAWLRQRAPLRAGTAPWFGSAAGKNLIVIQVESLQEPVVHLEINGHAVMPNLERLAADHLYFSNVVDQTDEGRTSDAEWLMLTSQLPAAQGAAAFVNAGNHLVGLPSVLAEHGYQSLSAVAFTSGFWNRRVIHPSVGFLRSYFAADFTPGDPIGWGLNDRDFLQQMAPRLEATREPFAAWLITLSLHYPFADFPDRHKVLDVSPWEHTGFGNYLHGMHYFDRALGDFIEALRRDGLLDRSVLVVTGDHSAGFRWQPEIAHALGFSNDIAHWTMAERVPLAVRVPGMPPQLVTRPVGQLDFAPTVLGLLGVDAAPLPYVGRNMLGNPGDEPVIRRKGGWVDAAHLFLLRGPSNGSHCYDRQTLRDVPLPECEAASALAVRKALLPRRIQDLDLQQRLYARLAADAAAPAPHPN